MIKYNIEEVITIVNFKEKLNANEYTKTWKMFGLTLFTKHYKNSFDLQDNIVSNDKSIGLRQ